MRILQSPVLPMTYSVTIRTGVPARQDCDARGISMHINLYEKILPRTRGYMGPWRIRRSFNKKTLLVGR
jgi:hypothetical protein